jgi:RNA recognition motif-containing protein
MMNNIRETSQQDRRVYVGNLSYDVKWHHLKDFMRQGASQDHGGQDFDVS